MVRTGRRETNDPQADHRTLEDEIHDLQARLAAYARGDEHPSAKVVADLSAAIHDLGDHLVALHQRVERIEDSQGEWTTRGWEPPPGADSRPGEPG